MITFSLLLLAINLWLVSIVSRLDGKHKRDAKWLRAYVVTETRALIEDATSKINRFGRRTNKQMCGIADQVLIKSSIATKMADRAFNMASSANLGVVALQKALAIPRLINRGQSKLNELAKNSVDELFTTQGEYDWLKPLLNDNDLELLEEIERKKLKDQMKS